MQEVPLSWAMLVAAIIRMVVGGLWFSPLAFVEPWQKIIGLNQEQMKSGMPRAIAVDAVGSLIMAWVLAHAVAYAQAATLGQGFAVGFFNWLGFVAVVQFTGVLYEQRPMKLFFLQSGFNLIALVLMGALLAVWGASAVRSFEDERNLADWRALLWPSNPVNWRRLTKGAPMSWIVFALGFVLIGLGLMSGRMAIDLVPTELGMFYAVASSLWPAAPG